jgi:hypothetical protein
MPNIDLTATEKRYLLYAFGVAFVWAIIVTSFQAQIQALPDWVQFFGITVLQYTLPGVVLAIYLSGQDKIDIRKVIGSILFFLGWDLLFPPLLLDLNGVLHTEGMIFGKASIDAVIASAWQGIGLNGLPLFIVTYPVTFLITQAVVVYMLTGKQIWDLIKV